MGGGALEKVFNDIWSYMTSHEEHFNTALKQDI